MIGVTWTGQAVRWHQQCLVHGAVPNKLGGDLRMLSGAAADPFRREHATPGQPLHGALLPQRGVASPAKAGSPPGRTLRPFPPTGPPAVPGPESFHQPSPGRQLCPACRTPAFSAGGRSAPAPAGCPRQHTAGWSAPRAGRASSREARGFRVLCFPPSSFLSVFVCVLLITSFQTH